MTPVTFRELALRLPAVEARPILDSVEFRVGGRTFATLGWPTAGWAVLQLTAEGQTRAVGLSRGFHSEHSPRGERGVTLCRLRGVEPAELAEVLADAWRLAYVSGEGAPPSPPHAVDTEAQGRV